MNFEAELKQDQWTLDDSVPIRVYGDCGDDEPEYIFEMPLNEAELRDLRMEVDKALRGLQKIRRLRCRKRR